MKPPLPVPPGCVEIPGICLETRDGRWITQDGKVTSNRAKRGVWRTAAEAKEAVKRCFRD